MQTNIRTGRSSKNNVNKEKTRASKKRRPAKGWKDRRANVQQAKAKQEAFRWSHCAPSKNIKKILLFFSFFVKFVGVSCILSLTFVSFFFATSITDGISLPTAFFHESVSRIYQVGITKHNKRNDVAYYYFSLCFSPGFQQLCELVFRPFPRLFSTLRYVFHLKVFKVIIMFFWGERERNWQWFWSDKLPALTAPASPEWAQSWFWAAQTGPARKAWVFIKVRDRRVFPLKTGAITQTLVGKNIFRLQRNNYQNGPRPGRPRPLCASPIQPYSHGW